MTPEAPQVRVQIDLPSSPYHLMFGTTNGALFEENPVANEADPMDSAGVNLEEGGRTDVDMNLLHLVDAEGDRTGETYFDYINSNHVSEL